MTLGLTTMELTNVAKVVEEQGVDTENVGAVELVVNLKPDREKLLHDLTQAALEKLGVKFLSVKVEVVMEDEKEECDGE